MHVVFKIWGGGWHCGACGFAAFAEDLGAVAKHVVQSQVDLRRTGGGYDTEPPAPA